MGRYEDLIKSFKAHMEKNPYARFLIFSNENDKTKLYNYISYFPNINENDNRNDNKNDNINYLYEIDYNPTLKEDISLFNMGSCCGGIAVNSSFSWIGGYLSMKTH
jgi:hypothetical protein